MPKEQSVMRFVEIITIYLAIGASVGVACYLHLDGRLTSRARIIAVALVAALFFPVTLLVTFAWRHRNSNAFAIGKNENDFDSARDTQIEHTKRALINTLHSVEEKIAEAFDKEQSKTVRQIISTAINHTDRYTGLSIAVAGAIPDASPTTRETELCNVAGRTGEDLSLAGRCVHRRNVARLLVHLNNARDDFFYSMRAVHKSIEKTVDVSNSNSHCTHDFTALMLQNYERAIELALLFDDRDSITNLARERDADCARSSHNMETETHSNLSTTLSTKTANPIFDELPTDLNAVLTRARPVI